MHPIHFDMARDLISPLLHQSPCHKDLCYLGCMVELSSILGTLLVGCVHQVALARTVLDWNCEDQLAHLQGEAEKQQRILDLHYANWRWE